MNIIIKILGVLLIIAGLIGGVYLGGWVCFVGGIIQIVEAIKATPVVSMGIAIGLLKVFSATLVGWITFLLCAFLGGTMVAGASVSRYSRNRW